MRRRPVVLLIAASAFLVLAVDFSRAELIEFQAANPAALHIPAGESLVVRQISTKGGAGGYLLNNFRLILSEPGEESTNSFDFGWLRNLYINGPATIVAGPVLSATSSGIPYMLHTEFQVNVGDVNAIRYDADGSGQYSTVFWRNMVDFPPPGIYPRIRPDPRWLEYSNWVSAGNTPLPQTAYIGSDMAESAVLLNYSRITNQPYQVRVLPAGLTNSLIVPEGKTLEFSSDSSVAILTRGYAFNVSAGVAITGPEEIQLVNVPGPDVPLNYLAIINYTLRQSSQDDTPSLALAEEIANRILSASNNYGIATKSDLSLVLSNTIAQVRAAPNDYNLFSAAQYEENRTNGQTDVISQPNAFGLFDSAQYKANRITGAAEGKAEVTRNPTAYNLFTESSIVDMNLGGLILKKGTDANELELELTIETKDSLLNNDWRVAERIAHKVNMNGAERQFLRVRAGAPYVAFNVKVFAHPTLGNILTDGAGRVLYYFAADSAGGNPLFSGANWPYVTVPEAPKADAGVSATLASSTFGKPGGPYLTVNARPVYTYVGDAESGQANGHGAGSVWWTIRADGVINQ